MDICFATNNEHKLQEIRSILGSSFNILSLKDIGCHEELPENQETLEGNSMEKASYVHENYKINCFADDTGLEAEALNGAPGVYSARYAGPNCTPADNMNLLLEEMKGMESRGATFRTIITMIIDGQHHQFSGEVKGQILTSQQGEKGFGYDPIFQPEGYSKTFAELSMDEKNKISHRGKATEALVAFLKTME